MTSPSSDPNASPPNDQDWLARTRYLLYGTAASFVELLQDPQKRAEDLGKLNWDINKLVEELVAKGELTEKEALRYVEEAQQGASEQSQETTTPDQETVTPPPSAEQATAESPPPQQAQPGNQVSQEDISVLMDLTREIEGIRRDLEQKRTDPD